MSSSAMLMAAGLGTRLRPFTHFSTKALFPVLGIPIAQFAIDSLLNSGVKKVVANIHHDKDRARNGILSLDHPGAEIVISDETEMLLGSAGGIRHALSQLGEGRFFLANADVICDLDWSELEAHHQKLRDKWGVHLTLTVFPVGPAGASYREILFDSNTGLVTGLGNPSVGRPFFVGAAILEKEALSSVPKEGPAEFVPAILDPAIRNGRAGVFLTQGSWYDIGSPQHWLKTHTTLISRLEKDDFSNQNSRLWKKRILALNTRIGNGVWVSNGSQQSVQMKSWVGPSYWHDSGVKKGSSMTPQVLGPNAVLYGSVDPARTDFAQGIGFGGEWLPII